MRYRLSECTLYRIGKAPGLEFTFRWPVMKLKDISEWSNMETRTIKVISDVCPIPLELTVRKFVPKLQDSLKKSWMDGKVKKYATRAHRLACCIWHAEIPDQVILTPMFPDSKKQHRMPL